MARTSLHRSSWRHPLCGALLLAGLLGGTASDAAPSDGVAPPPVRPLVSDRQLQAAMLAHNQRVNERRALVLCVDYVRLGSHIAIERCDTAGRLAREGLLRYRELTKHLRRQALRAGATSDVAGSIPALATEPPPQG